jgi:hypothetical protein
MSHRESNDCREFLWDVICYEVRGRRLSPEMKYLLDEHLENCPSCRRNMIEFGLFESFDPRTLWGELLN